MSARCKILRMSNVFFPALFAKDTRHFYEVVSDGLPRDATVVSVQMTRDFHSVEFLLQSEEFPEVAEGGSYPEIEPRLRTINAPEFTTTNPSTN